MKSENLVIIPAYNEASQLAKVLGKLKKYGFKDILVVDDGSTDKTYEIAQEEGVNVLRHCQNCGMGAATQTGIEWGLLKKFDLFFTLDADGQQDPKDLLTIKKALETKECVIGSRFLQKNDIPFFRRIANKIANLLTGVFFGVWVTDSQSGMRGFTKK